MKYSTINARGSSKDNHAQETQDLSWETQTQEKTQQKIFSLKMIPTKYKSSLDEPSKVHKDIPPPRKVSSFQ